MQRGGPKGEEQKNESRSDGCIETGAEGVERKWGRGMRTEGKEWWMKKIRGTGPSGVCARLVGRKPRT